MEAIRFGGVDRQKINDARLQLDKLGIDIIGDAGEITQNGYTVRYSYNELAKELTLILVKKPFFIPASLIRKKLTEALQKEGIYEV